MPKHLKHLRHQAIRHQEAHSRLVMLLRRHSPRRENVLSIFLLTFALAFLMLLGWKNREVFMRWFEPAPESAPVITQGVKTGVNAVVGVEGQAAATVKKPDANGGLSAVQANQAVGTRQPEPYEPNPRGIEEAVSLTQTVGSGQHLTRMDQSQAKSLLKSVLATFYLGEKTEEVGSALAADTRLLQSVKNALSVDLFQYLNQSGSRADALSGYLNLLRNLKGRSEDRIAELQSKIDFLSANVSGQEQQIRTSEQAFFENLKELEGPNAEEELGNFIGLRETQAESRAKLGAYQSLMNYYKFFLPKLDNLIRSIELNRDALVAGVKVTEIQNMALPLIIQQR